MNEILENTIEELRLDKSKWKPTKFGDVAIQQKGKVDRENTKLTRYIQGGHMNSEDLHIRNWGNLKDEYLGPAFIRKFEKGDILYGSRRTYLRKVAIADFDGITSNTTFVIKANEKNIDKRLLPFIMMSEGFTENSVKNSKGSVNPYINWKDIAKYELLLPPKDQQAELAELLWAMDEVIEREKNILVKNVNLRKSQLKETYFTIPSKVSVDKVILEKFIKLSSGKTRPKDLRDKPIDNYLYPVYGGNGIIGYSKDYLIEYDTIVLGRVGEYCGVVHDTCGKIWVSDNALYVKEFIGNIDKYYLSRFLEYIDLNKQQNKSSHPLITQSKVCSNLIPILSEELMYQQNLKLNAVEELILNLESKISSSKALQKSLINQVF
tara:strand:- start:10570 stop:11706 length:1137 start_codon:yes stop_codon:yes gene_type:complete